MQPQDAKNWQCPECKRIIGSVNINRETHNELCFCGKTRLGEFVPWSPMDPECDLKADWGKAMAKMIDKEIMGLGGKQQGGDHYGDPKTDPFAYGCANNLDPVRFSIVKYGSRLGKKGDRAQWILDARKAIQCTERRCLDLGISLEELYET